MATLDLYLNIRPEAGKAAFVQSFTSAAPFQFGKFYRESKMALRVFFQAPAPTGGFAAPFSTLDGTTYGCRVGIGLPGGIIYAAESLIWDDEQLCFTGVLNLHTVELGAALDAADGDLACNFEVELKSATDEFTFSQRVTVLDEVLTTDGGLPEDLTATLFADMLEDAVPPTVENDFPRTGNTFALRPAIYRDFTLSDAIRVENPRASVGVATYGTVTDSAIVSGLGNRRGIVKLRCRGVVTDNSYFGGNSYNSDTYAPADLGVNVGGTGTSGGTFVRLTVSSPAQIINLNAGSGGVGRAFDYILDVVVDPGATLTLDHIVDNGGLTYDGNSLPSVVPGVDPYPSVYAGEFFDITQVPVAGINSVASWQEESFSAAGDTELGFERYSAQHGVKVTAGVGAGAYTRTLSLLTPFRTRGDVAVLRVIMPASVNPSVEIRDADATGTLLLTLVGTVTATSYRVEAMFDGSAWVLSGVVPDLEEVPSLSLSLYAENPSGEVTPVASGNNSVAVGDGAEATATWSGVFGGKDNTASQQDAVVVGGRDNVASGTHAAVAGGSGNVSSARSAHAGGEDSLADIDCADTRGSGGIGAGLAQISVIPLYLLTSNATPTVMGTVSSGRLALRANTAWAFSVRVIARRASGAGHAAWKIEGVIYRDGTVGSTTLLGDIEVSPNSANEAGWDCAVEADTTNGALSILCTGGSYNVRWNARVELSEITYA